MNKFILPWFKKNNNWHDGSNEAKGRDGRQEDSVSPEDGRGNDGHDEDHDQVPEF